MMCIYFGSGQFGKERLEYTEGKLLIQVYRQGNKHHNTHIKEKFTAMLAAL